MVWVLTPFSLLAFLSACIFGVIFTVGWRRRWVESAPAFVGLMVAAFFWSLTYGIQLGFTDAASQADWQRITFIVSAFVPPSFLLFVLHYTGWTTWLTRFRSAAILGEAILFGAIVWTNPLHRLVWTGATLPPRSVSPALDLTFGPAYYGHIVFAYALVFMGLVLLLSIFFRRESISHNQAGLLVLGATPPFFTHVLYTLEVSPVPGLDLTPFVFVLTALVYGLALFHFDLMERMPLAQQRAIEIMGDGLLVVDEAGHVVDANDVARRVFDIQGRRLDHTNPLDVEDVATLDGTTRTVVAGGTRYAYDLHVSEITDQHGATSGYAVVLRDVSDRYAYEERLEVTNRVLRHNLRNDMNVIEGYARLLEGRAATDTDAAYAATIREKADDLIRLSEKAREMIVVEQRRAPDAPPADAVAIAHDIVADCQDDHPEFDISLDAPESAPVATVSERALHIAIRNLVENAIRHNDAPDPEVDVTVERIADRVLVSVADNGPGLPLLEQDVLQSGAQTPLRHSQGLGLWVTHWIVETTGGEIEVESATDGGTRISLILEAADGVTSGAGE